MSNKYLPKANIWYFQRSFLIMAQDYFRMVIWKNLIMPQSVKISKINKTVDTNNWRYRIFKNTFLSRVDKKKKMYICVSV